MRVLMVSSRFPLPPWRGNQVRTIEWLQALDGHDLAIVTPTPSEPSVVPELRAKGVRVETYTPSLASRILGVASAGVRGLPLQEGLYAVPAARQALRRVLDSGLWDVAVVQMMRCGWAADVIRSREPEVPILFDAIDAMGLHYRRAAADSSPIARPLLLLEAERCRRRELTLSDIARVSVAVSRRDLVELDARTGRVIPVAGREVRGHVARPQHATVLLSGNLGYRPTARAALWFAREVWPGLRARRPELRWVLAGARPAQAVRRLAELPGVEVHGDVPELAPFLARASVAIAPMASGSGVPMKVLEAWAAGVPVVAHPWAAAGLASADEPAVEVAEDPAQWIEALMRLLGDEQAAAKLAARGRAEWLATYHPDCVAEAVREAVNLAAGQRD